MNPGRSSILLVLALLAAAGCVVEERRPSRGRPLRPAPAPAGADYQLPDGPIAEPARGSTMSTRIRVALTPMGEVEYDGQTLPLISPDGRFAACQTGRSPTWDTLLAAPASEIPLRSEIAIYDLTGDRAVRAAPAEPLPSGLVLGRAADSLGFLVESPRPDGSRWIGRISWLGGRIEWLVQSPDVCAHAVLGPEGSLLYTRRAVGSPGAALVMRLAGGKERQLAHEGVSYAMPVWTGDPALVHAAQMSSDGTAIVAVRAIRAGPAQAMSGLGAIVARRIISGASEPVVGYQALSPVQSAARVATASTAAGAAPGGMAPLAFYHPAMERMVVLDPLSAGLTPLAPQSIGAVAAGDGRGYFCTTPRGLAYWALPSALEAWSNQRAEPDPEARVLAEPWVPRATSDAERPIILIGPARDPLRLKVSAMALAE